MVECAHCNTKTVAFTPAPHAGAIGICPGCNRVLTRWLTGWFDQMVFRARKDIEALEDAEILFRLLDASRT